MEQNTDSMTDEQIEATVAVDDVVFALKMNATDGADDRVIAVPQRDGAEASVRRAFRGSERYSNPSTAPVHIRPENLVEDAWMNPPERHEVDTTAIDVPALAEDRTEADEEQVDTAHLELIDHWEKDVRGMVSGSHEFELIEGVEITLVGVETDD
jgi:hypothetical protein